ncbi:MAG: RsmE family RNA methyltransferase [Alphaproteobacteria bacterium]|nr:RsmE family RNA methyltransferase [Alphaproteobacteria bacterium]
MLRLYTSENLYTKKNLILTDKMIRHLAARRITEQTFALFNEREGSFEARLSLRSTATVGKRICDPWSSPALHLYIALIKPKNLSFVLEKCTELGVTHFQLITTHFSQNYKPNLERLENVCKEAIEQCERFTPPKVLRPIALHALLDTTTSPLYVALERSNHTVAKPFNSAHPHILIGPEGGFSPEEKTILLAHKHCAPFSLGNAILRSETAAISGVANYLYSIDSMQ